MRLASSKNAATVAVSPDGKWLAASSYGVGPVRLWNVAEGNFVRDVPAQVGTFGPLDPDPLTFSPDSRWLVTGSSTEYRFWNVATGSNGLRLLRRQAGTRTGPSAFSPDGKVLAIARTRSLVELIDAASGKELASLEHPDAQLIVQLTFSPSGALLAAVCLNQTIQLWDLRALRQELAALNLDWEQLPPSPQDRLQPIKPLRVTVKGLTRRLTSETDLESSRAWAVRFDQVRKKVPARDPQTPQP
jgi:WD40 repeat protein